MKFQAPSAKSQKISKFQIQNFKQFEQLEFGYCHKDIPQGENLFDICNLEFGI